MSAKEKLLMLGVGLAILLGFLGHHYWSCAIAVLQRIVV